MVNAPAPMAPTNSDPLAQLPPLALPAEPGVWPLTPIWWLIIAVVCVSIIVICIAALRRWNRNRVKRESQSCLRNIWDEYQQTQDARLFCQSTATLIRQFCCSVPGHSHISALAGHQWVAKLNTLTPTPCFDTRCEEILTSYYRAQLTHSNEDVAHLHESAQRWLTTVKLPGNTVNAPAQERLT